MSIETIVNKVIDEWENKHHILKFGTFWREKLIKEIHQELIRMTKHQPCYYDNPEPYRSMKLVDKEILDMHFENL